VSENSLVQSQLVETCLLLRPVLLLRVLALQLIFQQVLSMCIVYEDQPFKVSSLRVLLLIIEGVAGEFGFSTTGPPVVEEDVPKFGGGPVVVRWDIVAVLGHSNALEGQDSL